MRTDESKYFYCKYGGSGQCLNITIIEDLEAIIRKAQKVDTVAMKDIYDSNVRYLSAVCYRYVGSASESKDILQDAFIKIFTSLKKFRYKGPESLRAGWRP